MRLPALLLFVGLASLALAAGCSNQGEGEFCDLAAGLTGGDCQDGLQCIAAPGLVSGTGDTFRCCPISSDPTTAACMKSSGALDAASDVPDAFAGGEASADAGAVAEAAADASSQGDALADATVDAPSTDGAVESGTDAGATSDASDASHE